MNINSVRIKNFKGVRDETELELRPFTLFIGENMAANKLRSLYYLGPFRLPPQRRYQTRGSSPLDVVFTNWQKGFCAEV
jgi:hypothetical protein